MESFPGAQFHSPTSNRHWEQLAQLQMQPLKTRSLQLQRSNRWPRWTIYTQMTLSPGEREITYSNSSVLFLVNLFFRSLSSVHLHEKAMANSKTADDLLGLLHISGEAHLSGFTILMCERVTDISPVTCTQHQLVRELGPTVALCNMSTPCTYAENKWYSYLTLYVNSEVNIYSKNDNNTLHGHNSASSKLKARCLD